VRGDDIVALDALTVQVPEGQVVAVIGSNGAGKSTMLAAIAGAMLIDDGQIWVGGQDVTEMASWQRSRLVARVKQDPASNVFSSLTIEQNFALAVGHLSSHARWRPALTPWVRSMAVSALEPLGMGLEGRLHTPVELLSGGQRQAVAVAMAAARRPAVMLLDEHVAALDPNSASLVMAETTRLVRAEGITTLMVTHDMTKAIANSDRILMMHRGRIVFDAQGDEKSALTVSDLIARFQAIAGEMLPDRMLLSASEATRAT
jgi:putative ABC transport system ATP-binding protein